VLDRAPSIRPHYPADMTTAAVAHWQIHTERGVSHLLGRAHAVDPSRVGEPHELSSLHIPVGGPRCPGTATVLEELGWVLQPPPVEPAANVKTPRRWW
jgi:hypothetical protein